jgi:hypothetical protein
MDRKAQSALEYLMTYGWALIVIAIVIGVLIFVTSGATGGVTCQSQSTGIIVKEAVVSSTSGKTGFSFMNATGGAITSVNATVPANFTGTATVYPTSVAKNSDFNITGLTAAAGNLNNVKISVTYNTAGGLPAAAEIVCNGTVA